MNLTKIKTLSDIRVRFAPSPTGFVHIGGLRTALYNYLFAKKNNGTFILRIEDTDRTRFVEGATENLMKMLEWAGLVPDEGPGYGGDYGPYFQSERTELYIKYAKELIEKGQAYYAFDTPEELDQFREELKKSGQSHFRYNFQIRDRMRNSLNMTEGEVQAEFDKGTPFVIRLLVPENKQFEFTDVIRGNVKFNSDQVDDQVLIKSDGFPTYHLANVVDDHLMKISHVIRGEEWLSSVPKHLLLYESFGWEAPVMAHLPLIFNPDGTKMSKRDIQSLSELPTGKVDPDVASYVKEGYEKEALVNYIALLGWNPGEGDDRQVFSLEELCNEFTLERVNKSAAIFDLKKLNWINSEHIAGFSSEKLVEILKSQLAEKSIEYTDDSYLFNVIELMKNRIHFSHELLKVCEYFFQDPDTFDAQVIKKRWKADSEKLLLEFCQEISKLSSFDSGDIESALRTVAERNEAGGGRIIHPVRLAVSGVGVGPGLFEMLHVLGKETVIRRLKTGVEKIPSLKQ